MKKEAALALLLVVIVTFLLMSSHLDAPFDLNHIGFTAAWYSLSAQNFLDYGVTDLYFSLTTDSGPLVDHPTLYLDHPAGISLLLAGVFRFTGPGELAARATGLGLSLGAAVFFFLFQRRLFRATWPALLGTLLAVSAPSWAFYGSLVDPHGPSLLFALAGALWAVLRWAREGRRRDLAFTLFFLVLGCLFDWAACLIAGGVGLWALLGLRRRPLASRLVLWGVPALFLAGLVALGAWAAAELGGRADLLGALANRSTLSANLPDAGGEQVPFPAALRRVALWHYKAGFPPLTLLGWYATFLLGLRLARDRTDREMGLILVPTGMGLVMLLLFFQALFEHEYLQIYFIPGLAMTTAWLLAGQKGAGPGRRRLALGAALVLLGLSLAWGWHRSRLRWAEHEPDLAACRVAGERIAAATARGDYILAGGGFLPPLAWYSDRRFFWELDRWWDERIPTDLEGLGGVLLTPRPSPRLEAIARRRGLAGPEPLLGGRYRLYLKQ